MCEREIPTGYLLYEPQPGTGPHHPGLRPDLDLNQRPVAGHGMIPNPHLSG